ncbi:MAG: hypothetical protein JJ863_12450 [Deltaproteobacteria bacterium]|nr:hypothetical protein [Deltaproteobacteria bacterium]
MRVLLIFALVGCSSSSGPAASEPVGESESAVGDRPPEAEVGDRPSGAEVGDRSSESESGSGSEPEAQPAPEPGTLRFVVVHDGPELLGSEERALAQLRTGLARGRTLDGAEPTDAERAWLDDPTALPAAWGRVETVVVLRMAAPQTLRNGRRMTRGFRSLHVVRPPATTPVYALDGGAEGPVGLAADKELEWLGALLDSLAEGEDS